MSKKTRQITLIAVGIALFVVLSMCLQVPVFENYYLCLGYIVMGVYCYSLGTISGTIVGFLGVVLYCLVISGLRGMPGWSLGNLVIGVALGLCFKATKNMKNHILKTIIQIVVIVASTALGILVIKSVTECILYSQPFLLRVAKNMSAFIADAAMLIIGLPIYMVLDKQLRKMFPDIC